MALAIGDWLIKSAMHNRQIGSLQLWELEAIAETAMVEYTDARCERYEAETSQENIVPAPDLTPLPG